MIGFGLSIFSQQFMSSIDIDDVFRNSPTFRKNIISIDEKREIRKRESILNEI